MQLRLMLPPQQGEHRSRRNQIHREGEQNFHPSKLPKIPQEKVKRMLQHLSAG